MQLRHTTQPSCSTMGARRSRRDRENNVFATRRATFPSGPVKLDAIPAHVVGERGADLVARLGQDH